MPAVTRAPAPSDGQAEITGLLQQHGLTGSAVAVAWFSFAGSGRSFIGARDPDGTVTPLIEFLPLPVRGADLLAAIAGIDENAPRLVANYRAAFPEIIDRLSEFGAGQPPAVDDSMRWLLSALSLTLWLEDSDLARALSQPDDGVKVDTVVIEQDGRYFFDTRRLLRSAMSYRIAGVPKHVLARSAFESVGDFTADAVRRLLRDWKADAVVCVGDLFASNRILRDRTRARMLGLRAPVFFPPAEDG